MTTDHRDTVLYEDGDAVVLADRSKPTAWIRSDTVVVLGTGESERVAEAGP